MKEERILTLALIRHGKTKGNEDGRYIGTTDEDLSAYGLECIKKLREKNIYPECELYFTSPRKRCIKTLEIITGGAVAETLENFAELSFGPFENKNYGQLKHDEAYRKWIDSSGEDCPEGCEKKSDFVRRNRAGLLEIATRAYEENKTTAMLVAHAGTSMAVTSTYTGCDYYDNIPQNGEGYLLEVTYEIYDGKVDNISHLGILRGICP